MKNIKKLIAVLAIVMVLLYACTPDKNFTVGTPQDRMTQLAGTWKLQSVTEVDLNARDNNFVDPSRPNVNLVQQDITTLAPYTDLSVTLVTDAGNTPTTFTVNYGNAPKIFKVSNGSWKVDNVLTPGTIKFINGTDTTATVLCNVNTLANKALTLQIIRYRGTDPYTQYNYIFSKN